MGSAAVFRNVSIFFQRRPWVGWAIWIVLCAISIGRLARRPFEGTFDVYLNAARHMRARELMYGPTDPSYYDPFNISGYLYWPISALATMPLTLVNQYAAAGFMLLLSAAVFSWAAVALMRALRPQGAHGVSAVMAAGILLLITFPGAWYNFKFVQAQIIMTGGMVAAAAAMIAGRWILAALWLFVAIVVKPLAIVMVLLCIALSAPMRLPLLAALGVALLAPFLFVDAGYLAEQYRQWMLKLYGIASVPPGEWIYQADFASMVDAIGLGLPPAAAKTIRAVAALVTLLLAWRVSKSGHRAAFAVAVLLLSGCYITVFGPRNEWLSFLVLTPGLAALALLMLSDNSSDWRGWALIAVAVAIGLHWGLRIDRVLKPALVCGVYVWLGWLMWAPERWRELIERGMQPEPPTR